VSVITLDWRHRAACRDADPDLFFPEGDPSAPAYAAQVAEALATCSACPVRLQCAEFGLGEASGIWAGTTEQERQVAASGLPGLCPSGRHLVFSPQDVTAAGICRACKQDRDRASAERRSRNQAGRSAARRARRPRKPSVRTKGIAA
jgi:WhiB family transcriptional regulator, redox-sensing transcriptional regulator